MNNNLLFATVKLPEIDKQQAAKQLLELPDNLSFWDNYRNTKMIPLMSKQGIGAEGRATNLIQGEFKWLPYTPQIIIDWFDNHVFPWMGMQSRVMALITQPNFSNYEHIDCKPNEVNTKQHKFRIVLQGKTDTLYFITKEGKVNAPDTTDPFVMDGGWPHGMDNTTDAIKITLAVGAPWIGNTEYKNIRVLLNRDNYSMPNDLSGYWNTGD